MTDAAAPTLLEVPGFLDFLNKEYLAGYVAQGGAAVKLLAVGDESKARLAAGLDSLGDGFQHATVDAVTTRVHMADQVFAAVARQLDWVGLAAAVVRTAFGQAGFPPSTSGSAGGQELSVDAVATHHDMDAAELYRSIRRAIEYLVLKDTGLSHEFRVAMLRLCQERLGRGDVTEAERESVIGWLRGERVSAGDLRKLGLHTKVSRHNARQLLLSTARWLRLSGQAGLLLRMDLTRLAVARRPPAGLRDGHYYSKAATLDAYELLRQLIDGTDEFEGIFVAVLLPPELINDETRGLPAYTALRLRVVDEVRDRHRANPYSALVRIGSQQEVAV